MAQLCVEELKMTNLPDISRAKLCQEAFLALRRCANLAPKKLPENRVKHLTARFSDEYEQLMIVVSPEHQRRVVTFDAHVKAVIENLKALGLARP
jgi:hypothetical protein